MREIDEESGEPLVNGYTVAEERCAVLDDFATFGRGIEAGPIELSQLDTDDLGLLFTADEVADIRRLTEQLNMALWELRKWGSDRQEEAYGKL